MSVDERIVELLSEWGTRRANGEDASIEDLCQESPDLVGTLRGALRTEGPGPHDQDHDEATALRPRIGDGETVTRRSGSTTGSVVASGEAHLDAEEIGRLGPYRVLSMLGAGGMGVVFKAIDDTLGRPVALKVLRPSLAHLPRAQERFLREARAAAALEHDHIVTIFQVGEDRGMPYLAMPLLAGTSLETRLERDGRLPIAEVLRIGREIAEGLGAAHRNRVIHRDIKPANIWLEGERGRVKILDFGLARASDETQRITQEDTIIGTPAYMAPEQATGAKQFDARLDLFSLGSVLYKMATGKVPFSAAGRGAAQTLVALVKLDPKPPRTINPEIPPALNDLILKLLAKDPEDRLPSARAVVEAIERIEDSQHSGVPLIELQLDPPAGSRPPGIPARPKRTAWIVGVVGALVVFGVLTLAVPPLVGLFDDKGRLTVETPVPYVLVVVQQSGEPVAIIDPEQRTTVALRPGSYDLALEGEHQGLKLLTDRVTLRRGDEVVIKVVPRIDVATSGTGATVVAPETARAGDLPGLIPHPGPIAGREGWQVETRLPRTAVRSLAWSPNRHRLACVAVHENMVRIYDAELLELVGLLVGHSAPVLSVSWSPSGQQLATVSLDGTVRLWQASGTPGPILKAHEGSPTCLAWGPAGHWLATGGTDRVIRIWGRDGTLGRTLDGNSAGITALAWSPDASHLIAGTSQGSVHFWNVDGTRGPSLDSGMGTHPVLAVSWSADGQRMAAGGHDGARIWLADGTPGPELEDAPASVTSLAWSPTAPTLATAFADGTVRLWNDEGQPGPIMAPSAGSGSPAAPGPTSTQGPPGVIALAWSPDGTRLAASGHDGAVRQWNADGTPGPVLPAALSPFRALAWSPDGEKLLSDFPLDPSVRIWDRNHARSTVLKGNNAPINTVAFSPDGHWIAAGDGANTVRLWSEDGKPGRVFREPAGAITSIAWSPDSRRFVAGSYNNTVHLVSVVDAEENDEVLNGHTAHVLAVAWSSDGRRVASGGADCTIRLWDVSDRSSIVLGKLAQRVNALAWSPSGQQLASASQDGLVRLWTDSASPPLSLNGHAGSVHAVCWSPDGRKLASGGEGGRVRLWSAEGAPGPVFTCQAGTINALAWSPDGRRIAAAYEDGVLRIWSVDTAEMERLIVPTSATKTALLDRNGLAVSSTAGAERDLFVYDVPSQGAVSLLSYFEFQKTSRDQPRPDPARSRSRGGVSKRKQEAGE